MRKHVWLTTILALGLVLPAAAGDPDLSKPRTSASVQPTATAHATSSGLGWQAWGLRVGMAQDVDQVVGGAHVNFGELTTNLRFQPDLELGEGDDATTLYGTAPLYYRFRAG